MRYWVIFLAIGITTLGCDTTSSIDPPDESFFLKFYGYEGDQEGVDAVLNADGTVTLFGNTDSELDGKQLYLVNIEPNGKIVWEQTYGGPLDEFAKDIELTNDGRLVIVAEIENSPGEKDIMVMTLTLDGNLIAETNPPTGFVNLSGSATDETAVSITQTSDGFIVVGSTSNLDLKPTTSGGSDTRDALHVRYFNDLTVYPNSWRQAHGPGDFDSGVKIIQTLPDISGNEQFYYFGYSNTQKTDLNFYVLRLGSTGESNGANDFLPGNPASDETLGAVSISPVQSGEGFILTGTSKAQGSPDADLFIVKLRKTLNLGQADFQFQKSLAINLGAIPANKTSVFASQNSGFLILANEKSSGIQNFYLTKIGNDGTVVWQNPIVFGGEKDDQIGSVLEFPDGSIGMIGTFAVGQDGEKKMTFIKVNKEGKFSK